MMKRMELSEVPIGENFEIWGHEYTVLDKSFHRAFVLETSAVCVMPFKEGEVVPKIAMNDFRTSSVRVYLEGSYLRRLVDKHADMGGDILSMNINLISTLLQHEYDYAHAYVGILTLEEYGKYFDIIPKIDVPYWTATPFNTPLCSPETMDSNIVWCIDPDSSYSTRYCTNSLGVRPTLALDSSIAVYVGKDESKEDRNRKWCSYLRYVSRWAGSHIDKKYVDSLPLSFDEWLKGD